MRLCTCNKGGGGGFSALQPRWLCKDKTFLKLSVKRLPTWIFSNFDVSSPITPELPRFVLLFSAWKNTMGDCGCKIPIKGVLTIVGGFAIFLTFGAQLTYGELWHWPSSSYGSLAWPWTSTSLWKPLKLHIAKSNTSKLLLTFAKTLAEIVLFSLIFL